MCQQNHCSTRHVGHYGFLIEVILPGCGISVGLRVEFLNPRCGDLSYAEHPILFWVWIAGIPLWREFHFYWVHRFIHWKPLYKHVHALHHKNVDVNPWFGMAMHPIEQVLYLSVCVIRFVIPSNPFHFFFTLQHAYLAPVSGHLGFEDPVVNGKAPIGSYFNYLHHRYFEYNYGESVLPLDKCFKTERQMVLVLCSRSSKNRSPQYGIAPVQVL